jgi:hypothetical protein
MSSLPTPASKALALEPKAQAAVRDQVHDVSISLEMAVIDTITFYQPHHVKSGTLEKVGFYTDWQKVAAELQVSSV